MIFKGAFPLELPVLRHQLNGFAGGEISADNPVRCVVVLFWRGSECIQVVGVSGPADGLGATLAGDALEERAACQQPAVVRQCCRPRRGRVGVEFPAIALEIFVGRAVNQRFAVVGNVAGQRRDKYIEYVERRQCQARIEITGAVEVTDGFLGRRPDAPLPGVRQAGLPEGPAQLGDPQDRIVIGRTGADFAGRFLP